MRKKEASAEIFADDPSVMVLRTVLLIVTLIALIVPLIVPLIALLIVPLIVLLIEKPVIYKLDTSYRH